MFHANPHQPPDEGHPPQEVRILELRAEPWPDQSRRVRIHLQLTPFIERPNLEVIIQRENGEKVSNIDIIETIDNRMTFTMHLKGDTATGRFNVQANLAYPEIGVVDQKNTLFEVTELSA